MGLWIKDDLALEIQAGAGNLIQVLARTPMRYQLIACMCRGLENEVNPKPQTSCFC